MKIAEFMVQVVEKENRMLKSPLFDVNMRLFTENASYRGLILHIIEYMSKVLHEKFKDYPKLMGISGANVGVPYNLVIVRRNEPEAGVHGSDLLMVNPKIVARSKELKPTKSNCGSVNLSKKISVERHEWVQVVYCDVNGKLCSERFTLKQGGGTIQHEIEHNLGILITDH